MQGASRAGGVQRDPPEQPRGGAAVDRRGASHARAGKGEEKTAAITVIIESLDTVGGTEKNDAVSNL